MTTSEAIGKAASQAVSFFEKATEFRFFLHALCIALYFELISYVMTKHSLTVLTWKDIETIQPGQFVLGLLGYFALMGYGFRMLYFVVSLCLGWLTLTRFFQPERTSWRKLPGFVSEVDIVAKSYASKDYEPVRILEAHRKSCADDRKETKELAYLYFSAFFLGWFNYAVLPISFLMLGYTALVSFSSQGIAQIILLISFIPWLMIWIDASDDYDRDRYINHAPIYAELEEEKRIEREKRGY